MLNFLIKFFLLVLWAVAGYFSCRVGIKIGPSSIGFDLYYYKLSSVVFYKQLYIFVTFVLYPLMLVMLTSLFLTMMMGFSYLKWVAFNMLISFSFFRSVFEVCVDGFWIKYPSDTVLGITYRSIPLLWVLVIFSSLISCLAGCKIKKKIANRSNIRKKGSE